MIFVTAHARDRLRQRLRRGEAAVLDAWDHGIPVSALRGRLQAWVLAKIEAHGTGLASKLRGRWLYIFDAEDLITVLCVPPVLRKQAEKQQRRAR